MGVSMLACVALVGSILAAVDPTRRQTLKISTTEKPYPKWENGDPSDALYRMWLDLVIEQTGREDIKVKKITAVSVTRAKPDLAFSIKFIALINHKRRHCNVGFHAVQGIVIDRFVCMK